MLVPLEDARRRIDRARFSPLRVVRVPLLRAVGRLAGTQVTAPSDLPAGPVSAMDGYAVHLRGAVGAGPFVVRPARPAPARSARPRKDLGAGEAAYITTGEPLPPGANSVVRLEATRRAGEQVHLNRPVTRGQDVLDPGESVTRGDVLLERGQPISPAHVGVLLAEGLRDVPTFEVRAAVVPVGGDLAPAGSRSRTRTPDFLGPVIAGLLDFADVTLFSPVPDDRQRIAQALVRASHRFDLILTIGGSSAGERDVTKGALTEVGDLWFEGVRANVLKRGAVGAVRGTPVVVLPGQLVSCVAAFHEHALHLISQRTGHELRRFESVRLGTGIEVRHRMDSVYLFTVIDGRAMPLPWGVARMTALLRAQAFGVLLHGRSYRAGETIRVMRLPTRAS